MTRAQLTAGAFRARRRFHSWQSIARRGLDRRCNARSLYRAGVHVAANAVARREILTKQGTPLGAPTARIEAL